MGCGTSKPGNAKDGRKEYQLRFEPETTMTDLADRGEPEGEEKGRENGWHKDTSTKGVQQEVTSRDRKDSTSNLENLNFNDQQEVKAVTNGMRNLRQ